MQLSRLLAGVAAMAVATTTVTAPRGEIVGFHGRTTYYREGLPFGYMNVLTPSAELAAKPWDGVSLRAGWSADVVSGASIKIRNAVRGADPDAVSSASVRDFRQATSGGFSFSRKLSTLSANYSYGWENDYRSHAIDLLAKTELLQRSMELSLAYARNWDSVCDRLQSEQDPTRRRGLETSNGCFRDGPNVTTRPISIDAIQAGWTQLWTPTLATQLTGSIQISRGFLSNPYREVNLGVNSPAQEYVPEVRSRLAVGARANWYLKPLKTAFRIGSRLYRDTWDIRALSVDGEIERYVLLEALRVRLRGRWYTQGRAAFYSDDYLVEPRGQYFTGDRELSTMRSLLAGGRISYGPIAGDARFLGLLEKVEISLGVDGIWFDYDDFTINGVPLAKTAVVGSVGLSLLF
jgi:hypothetical protein